MKTKFKGYTEIDPRLEEGYKKIIKAFSIYGNIPWVIMGLGMLLGSTQSIFDYFRPRDLNPFVLAFHASVIIIYIFTIRWLYFKDGAKFLEQHPGIFQKSGFFAQEENISANKIKILFGLMLLGGILAMSSMWAIDIPVMSFPK